MVKNNTRKNIDIIEHSGIKYTSDEDIAEIFNDFFVNIARTIENSLPPANISPYCVMIPNTHPCIEINPVTPDVVSNIINSLKNTKTDIDHIPVSIFKSFRDYFVPTLCN